MEICQQYDMINNYSETYKLNKLKKLIWTYGQLVAELLCFLNQYDNSNILAVRDGLTDIRTATLII